MQNTQKQKKSMFRTDLRPALVACAMIGAVLLGLLAALTGLERFDLIRRDELPY